MTEHTGSLPACLHYAKLSTSRVYIIFLNAPSTPVCLDEVMETRKSPPWLFFFYCRKLRIVNFFTLEEFACAYLFIFRSLQCLDCTRSFLTLLVFIENITPQHCKLNRMPKGQKFRKSLNFLQRHRSGKLGQIFKGHNLNNIRCPKTEDHVIFYLNLKMKAQSGMWNKFFSRFAIHFISYFSSKNFESVCFVRLFIFR